MNGLSLYYAHKMWEHYAQYMRSYQQSLAKTYLWLNVTMLVCLGAMPKPDDLMLYFYVLCIFIATVGLAIGVTCLSSLFIGKGAPDPIDKFKSLRMELEKRPSVLNAILHDYDEFIPILKRQTSHRGYLLRAQSICILLTLPLFVCLLV